MERSKGNARLAALLVEARLSAGELARTVNALAAAQQVTLTYDRTSVAHWLKGSKPRHPVPHLVALALSRRTGRPVTVEETGLAPLSSGPVHPRSGAPQSPEDLTRELASLCRADTDPSLRVALVKEIYVPLAGLPVWRPRSPSAERLPSSASRAAGVDAARLSYLTNFFADLSDRYGGDHARSALAAYTADDVCRLLAFPGSSGLRGCQFAGAAQLVHVLARMTADAGHAHLAQHYYLSALALAEAAGDRKVYAVTLRAMSVQAVRMGFLVQGWEMADLAVRVAHSSCGPAAQAFVFSQRAVVHARLHRRKEALRRPGPSGSGAPARHYLARQPLHQLSPLRLRLPARRGLQRRGLCRGRDTRLDLRRAKTVRLTAPSESPHPGPARRPPAAGRAPGGGLHPVARVPEQLSPFAIGRGGRRAQTPPGSLGAVSAP